MIGVMIRSSNGSSILPLSNLLCDVPNSFPYPYGRNLEILFKRIYWQVLLQKAIDNRTMLIGHPAFAD